MNETKQEKKVRKKAYRKARRKATRPWKGLTFFSGIMNNPASVSMLSGLRKPQIRF